jgi:hypothetical protein
MEVFWKHWDFTKSVGTGVWFAAKEAPCTTQMSLLRNELVVQALWFARVHWEAVDTITSVIRDYQHTKRTGIQINRSLIKIWMSSSIQYMSVCNRIYISIYFTACKSDPRCEWITTWWQWLLLLLRSLWGTFWCRRNNWAWSTSAMATGCSLWGMHRSDRNSWATTVCYNLTESNEIYA